MWLMNTIFVTIAGLVIIPPVIVLLGITRWQVVTRRIRAQVELQRSRVTPSHYHLRELEGLPAPVQRYFRTVLREGQPLIAAAEFGHEGRFNLGRRGREVWVPFTATELAIMQRVGFDWDGRLRMMPGLSVFVHDAYAEGTGILCAAAFGLLPLPKLRPSPELARAQLLRFLAESPWYPTRLLPSQGVLWTPIDADSAQASLTDGEYRATMRFVFDDNGLIERVEASDRPRAVRGRELVPTPWEGRFWDYQERGGMRIPLQGEVAWLPPEGRLPYWRGRLNDILYKFTP